MSILARLDGLVKRSGLYPGLTAPPRPRHTRWLPLVGLSLAVAGIAAHIADTRLGVLRGYDLLVIAFVFSSILTLLSPLRRPTPDEPLDERERTLRSRSYSAAFGLVATLCIGAALLFSLGDSLRIGRPTTREDWRAIFFLLLVLLSCVPPLYASWSTRPVPDEA